MKRFLVTLTTQIVIEGPAEFDAAVTAGDSALYGLYKYSSKDIKELAPGEEIPADILTIQSDLQA